MDADLAAEREDATAMAPAAVKTMLLDKGEFQFCRVRSTFSNWVTYGGGM
ncbi:hypothetical protein M8C21_020581 [Ambrosia artemisiifolia]|uniref:Uncharacterized protein n=1 Tax=Ambrosia artemisiifolia TaxID=4212 RepID=A0AAD5C999_AMBAR|nr:hypothetical protein M8C21_018376 [Ambrosia artemisiifolia]KAI7739848.1 hypothetical protein M8C21_020581 [Ambrosia artemisiifolia]